ncbi:hypothetical protein [Maribacter sp. R77961]|uniref:hypothetical protein n=1 Tax=Maribacter sp. R77961 TaxID=3093871 RepID=UPI0037C83FFF
MKTIATIFFIFFIGMTAQAQNNTADVKVETVEMTIVTETAYELNLETKTTIARLYRHKNARVNKALSFTTKRNKAKMA